MANIFEKGRSWLLAPLLGTDAYQRIERIDRAREYRVGEQRMPLKKKRGIDHNVIINLVGTVVDRSIALLFGGGVEFDLPGEGETNEDIYLSEVWRLNKKAILLHKLGLIGSEVGTCAIQIIPDDIESSKLGVDIPRLIALDTAFLTIETEPDDVDKHTRYVMEYKVEENGKETAKRRIVEPIDTGEAWLIIDEIYANGKWREISRVIWNYSFPPLIAWQNLPTIGEPYGQPDITPDIIRLQDKVNFIASNINKIIATHASPRTIGKNITGGIKVIDNAPDQMFSFSGDNSDLFNLEMQSDLSASQAYLEILRQSLMDTTHTIDISSMVDKVGALTNFGLRVLYQDALQKLKVKQELYGDALLELNRALLVLGGFGNNPDPGEIVWAEPLPVNEKEIQEALHSDLLMGIVSKQTIAERRGYDWEKEQELISTERASEGNIGEEIMRGFGRGYSEEGRLGGLPAEVITQREFVRGE